MRNDINAKLTGAREEKRRIFIQIDGVPYEILKKAIEKKYMPNLKKIIKFRGYKFYKLYSELPSNTPAAQMKIMYGLKGIILGFRWFNKKQNRHYSFKDVGSANYWENEGEKRCNSPLLKNGASYINMFSGGAERAILTFSKAMEINIKRRIKNNEVWQFILLNMDFIVKAAFETIKEFFTELYEYLKYKIKKIPQRSMKFFPYVRVTNAVFFREIATMGALIEMNEMRERIYLTYTAYDEVAHQRGPETKEALKTLRRIDRSIGKLIKSGLKKGYELYIFSDHGQTSSTPFEKIYGMSIEQFINEGRVNDNKKENKEGENSEQLTEYFFKRIFKWMVEEGYNLSARFIKRVFKIYLKIIKKEKSYKNSKIIVEKSGPMAHIYFNEIKERVVKSELEKNYSDIIKKITDHEGIEFSLFKTEKGYELCGKKGIIILDENFEIKEEKGYLLSNIIEIGKEEIINSLKEVAFGEESGDIILFGAVIGKNRVVNFEEQYGGHGGIGGMQNYPFIISKKYIDDNELTISKLYSLFNGEREG